MFFCAELWTITRTLIACVPCRARVSRDLSPHMEHPTSGPSETLPAKDESSNNGVQKYTDTALDNKSTLFPSKGEGISTFFFNDRFHNGKVDRYLSSFSGSVLLTQATSLSTYSWGHLSVLCPAGSPLPADACLSCCVEWASAASQGDPGQVLWPHESNLFFFPHGYPRPQLKKQILKEATFYLLCIKTFNTKSFLCRDTRN